MVADFSNKVVFFFLSLMMWMGVQYAFGVDMSMVAHANECFVESPQSTPANPIFFYKTNSGFVVFEKGKVTYQRVKVVERKTRNSGEGMTAMDSLYFSEPSNVQVENIVNRFVNCNNEMEIKGVLPDLIKLSYISSEQEVLRNRFHELIFSDIYEGISIKYYFKSGNLKYDILVEDGAAISNIKIKIDGADEIRKESSGTLQLILNDFVVTENIPLSYFVANNDSVFVNVDYNINISDAIIGFVSSSPQNNFKLVIDPSLFFSTYLGGGLDDIIYVGGMDIDLVGNVYFTGRSLSSNFPTTSGVYQTTNMGNYDAFVIKYNRIASALVFSTYIGGIGIDAGYCLRRNPVNGNLIVGGGTYSSNFPSTGSTFQPLFGGGSDGFVFMLNSAGSSIVSSTFFGQFGADYIHSLDIDAFGSVYVTGETESTVAVTAGALQSFYGGGTWDGFVAKFNPSLTNLIYSTYIGGNSEDVPIGIRVNSSGEVFVAGWTASSNFPVLLSSFDHTYNGGSFDAFALRLNQSGSALIYSTFLGTNSLDRIWNSMKIDNNNELIVAGYAGSGYPITANVIGANYSGGSSDVFITKLSASGSSLLHSTYLGSGGSDFAYGMSIDSGGKIVVSGSCNTSFPISVCSYDSTFNGGGSDAFISIIDSSFSNLLFSTFVGGSNSDVAYNVLFTGNDVVFCGETFSTNFPITPNAFDQTFNGSSDITLSEIEFGNSAQSIFSCADTICESEIVQFTNGSLNSNSYLWNFGDNSTSNTYQPSHHYLAAGTYTIMLIVQNCSVNDTSYQNIVVKSVPSASFTYQNNCNGGLTVNADSSALNYVWDFGGLGNSNLDSTYFNFGLLDSALVTLIASNGIGCSDTLSTMIYFPMQPTASFTASTLNCSHVISLMPDTTNSINYSWSIAGNSIQNSGQNFTYLLDSIGIFNIVLIVGSGGCTDTISHTVQIDSIPVAQFNVLQTCINPVQFFNTSLAYNSALWFFADGDSSTLFNPSHQYVQEGAYAVSLFVTDQNGCRDTITTTVNAFNPPVASFVSSSIACTRTINVQVDSINNANYYWNIGGHQFQNSGQDILFSFDSAGVFNVELIVDSAGCTDTLKHIVIIETIPTANFNFLNGCDTIIQFSNTSSDFVLSQWFFADGDSSVLLHPSHQYALNGNYLVSLIVEDANGCKDTISKTVIYHHPPVASFFAEVIPCTNEVAVVVDSSGSALYHWQFGGLQFQNFGQDFTFSANSTGFINIVLIVDSAGCTDTISQNVFVRSIPTANFSIESNCVNPIQFVNSSHDFVSSYWMFGDGDSSIISIPLHQYVSEGNYFVSLVVSDSLGCKDTISNFVNAHTALEGEIVSLLDSCSGKYQFYINPDSLSNNLLWDFGDGTFSNLQSPVHSYINNGTYYPIVLLNPGAVCVDSITSIMTTESSIYQKQYFPNCFSPNNDGKNDFFFIVGNGLCDYTHYAIYSRWGQLIYKSTTLFEKWNGKKDGEELPEGVYVIILEGKSPLVSFVTILR